MSAQHIQPGFCRPDFSRTAMKKIALYLALLVVLTIPACTNSTDPGDKMDKPSRASYKVLSVEGFVVKPALLQANLTASGSLLPLEETELHPETSGRVVALNLPEGKSVRKGEVLVKLFDQDLQTQLRKLDSQVKQAEITEQRLAELLKVKGVSQQEYDLAALEVQTLKSEQELLRINIGKTELRAPYNGVIGLRRISPGAYVTPATAIATLRSAGALKLDFAIPEKYSSRIRTGQTVNFTVEGHNKTYAALVQATEQSITTDTRNLQVRAVLRDNNSGLLPGTFAQVSLNLGSKAEALLIPSQAIVPQAREKIVFVSRNGQAEAVSVRTGIRQSDMVEVLEGLKIGDTIATTGILFLRPEVPLQFSKVE